MISDIGRFYVEIMLLDSQNPDTVPVSDFTPLYMIGEKAKDENGYLFEHHYYTTTYLENAFESGHLQPGQEYQGEISFEIPKSSENIEMWYTPYSGPYIYIEL